MGLGLGLAASARIGEVGPTRMPESIEPVPKA